MNWPWKKPQTVATPVVKDLDGLRRALSKALEQDQSPTKWPIRAPELMKGVVPTGSTPAVAMDAGAYDYASSMYSYGDIGGFPGYPYLAMLTLRPEYRAMATGLSNELTRKWIKLQSTETASDSTKKKITELEKALDDFNVQNVVQLAAEHDGYFGRGQIYIDLQNAKRELPLILSDKTVKKGTLLGFRNVEPMWTTPVTFNALDPADPYFYNPQRWWVMGQDTHSSRLLTIITRPVPDMLKPAFNFGGISLSQLAEPYVNNWLRTRQSVSDLVNNFSIVVLKTAMDQVLSGSDDGTNLFARIKLFTATRSNKKVMALDKDREELEQIAVPLGGLHELQSQAQEHMCSVSREPAIVLTGISPSGLNASSDGEIRIWYDWTASLQQSFYRKPTKTMLDVIQLSMYGEIDPDITFDFVPLYQMSELELSNIRNNDSIRAGNYIDRGVIDAQEERERLARDPESGYQGIDIEREIAPPDDAEESANLGRGTDSALGYDADFVEGEHPRDDEGKFSISERISGMNKPQTYHLQKQETSNIDKKRYETESSYQDFIDRRILKEGYTLRESPVAKKEDFQKTVPLSKSVSRKKISPHDLIPVNDVDENKVDNLAMSMMEDGWKGNPLVVFSQQGNGEALTLTGSHRISAAKKANIEVPTVVIKRSIEKLLILASKRVNAGIEVHNGRIDRITDPEDAAQVLEDEGYKELANLIREN